MKNWQRSAALALGVVFTAATLAMGVNQVTSAACAPLPSGGGTATFVVNVPANGSYMVWTHMYVPTAGTDAVYMQIGDQCQVTVGNSPSIPAGQFSWVNYRDGNATSKITVSLNAGNQTISLAGLDTGVGVDKVLLLTDHGCVPTGQGDNCSAAATVEPPQTPSVPASQATPADILQSTKEATNNGSGTIEQKGNDVVEVSGIIRLPGAPQGVQRSYFLDGKPVYGSLLDTTLLFDGLHILQQEDVASDGTKTVSVQKLLVKNNLSATEKAAKTIRKPWVLAPVVLLTLLILLGAVAVVLQRFRPVVFQQLLDRLHVSTLLEKLHLRRVHAVGPANGTDNAQAVTVVSMHKSSLFSRLPRLWVAAGVAGFTAIGAGLVVASFAVSASTGFLLHKATVSGNAAVVDNAAAIGGKMVRFGTTQGVPTPPATPPATPPPVTPPTSGGTAVCPPFPAFPDANCTGYKHTTGFTSESQLKLCKEGDGEEDGHFMKANAVYDGCLFKQMVRVRAPGIVIKNSKIIGNVAPPAGHHPNPYDYQGLQLIDVEITPFSDAQIASFMAPGANQNVDPGSEGPIGDGANYTCTRCYIHHAAKSAGGGSGVKFIDSYVDSITWTEGQHGAAFGMNNGFNVEIIHNNLDCYRWNVRATGFQQGCSSALSIYDEGPLDGVLVKNNLFNTAGQYCAYSGGPTGKNVRFIDNRFGKKHNPKCGAAGPLHSWYPSNPGYLWQGNMWADGSGVVNP